MTGDTKSYFSKNIFFDSNKSVYNNFLIWLASNKTTQLNSSCRWYPSFANLKWDKKPQCVIKYDLVSNRLHKHSNGQWYIYREYCICVANDDFIIIHIYIFFIFSICLFFHNDCDNFWQILKSNTTIFECDNAEMTTINSRFILWVELFK